MVYPSGRGFKWLQVNIGLICPASSASSKAKRIRSAFRTFCEYFLTFHAIYERRAMLSLASYEKDGRGKLERYGEKRLCLLLMCCWVHSWEQSKSEYLQALLRLLYAKVNSHSSNEKKSKQTLSTTEMTKGWWLITFYSYVEVYFGFSTKMLMQYDPIFIYKVFGLNLPWKD